MKKLLTFTNAVAALALACGVAGCTTTTSNTAAIDTSQKEMMLTKAGFMSKTVTTPKLEQQVAQLSPGVVSAVKAKGKLLYVFPTGTKKQVLVGKQSHYDAYKKTLANAPARSSTGTIPSTGTTAETQASDGAYLTGETAGPNRVVVQEFDGFEEGDPWMH